MAYRWCTTGYPEALNRALDALGGLNDIRARQKTALAEGKYLGLGIGCYVEGTGVGPFEGASVKIDYWQDHGRRWRLPAGTGPRNRLRAVRRRYVAGADEDVFVTVADTGRWRRAMALSLAAAQSPPRVP